MPSGNQHQHLAALDDPVAVLGRRLQASDLFRRQQRPVHRVVGAADVAHRAAARAALGDRLHLDRRGAEQIGDPFLRVQVGRRIQALHVAMRRDALVRPVGLDDLLAILRQQVALDAVARALAHCVLEARHRFQRRKLVDQHQHPVPVRRHRMALHVLLHVHAGQRVHRHGEEQPDQRPERQLVGRLGHHVQRDRRVAVHQIEQPEVTARGVARDNRIVEQPHHPRRRREGAGPFPLLTVELLLRRDGNLPVGCPPGTERVVDHRLVELIRRLRRITQCQGDVGQGRDPPVAVLAMHDVEDDAGQQRRCVRVEMPFQALAIRIRDRLGDP